MDGRESGVGWHFVEPDRSNRTTGAHNTANSGSANTSCTSSCGTEWWNHHRNNKSWSCALTRSRRDGDEHTNGEEVRNDN